MLMGLLKWLDNSLEVKTKPKTTIKNKQTPFFLKTIEING